MSGTIKLIEDISHELDVAMGQKTYCSRFSSKCGNWKCRLCSEAWLLGREEKERYRKRYTNVGSKEIFLQGGETLIGLHTQGTEMVEKG